MTATDSRNSATPDQPGRGPSATGSSPATAASRTATPQPPRGAALRRWMMHGADAGSHQGPHQTAVEQTHSWWQVMCLTGVDYFSTLGYQPAIAALAAGLLSPIATIVLVAVTLLGALPVYRRVAQDSFRGAGSIQMLEKLLPWWWAGKVLVLVLLGFAVTDFMITITLSAADATAHLAENPYTPHWFSDIPVPLTLALIALLGVVFLRGFTEAMSIAVVLVGVYLALNLVVVVVALVQVVQQPHLTSDWWSGLTAQHSSPFAMIGIALLVFPKLALGLSGFETGVSVMPQVRGDASDAGQPRPEGRIRGTKRLLTTAALIMSAFLILSSIITTFLIPQREFQAGGQANGRALAFLAHEYLGPVFGTVYDASTIAILWFAGASAMAGLLNLVPRFLPRYGMAPQWARAVRPLVVIFTLIAFVITIVFHADVDAQGGAYATGVLVLITSASVAVTLSARRRRQRGRTVGFAVITVVFAYTTVANVFERPDGVRIAAIFIVAIVVVSLVSRVRRSFQLRASSIELDAMAQQFVTADADQFSTVCIIAIEPGAGTADNYRAKGREERRDSGIPARVPTMFLEILPADSSDFEEDLIVEGHVRHGFRVLSVRSGNVPNTIASTLLAIRDLAGIVPSVYFEWTEGSPIRNMLRFLFTGGGEVAPVTREVLREAEADVSRRPVVHVS